MVAASPQILKNAFLSSLLLAPIQGVCGERSETEGGGFAMGHSVARVRPGNGFRPLSESDAQPAAGRRPQPSGCSPVNPHTEGVSKGKKQK